MKTAMTLAVAVLAGGAQAQLINGGFETGDFTGWAYAGNSQSDAVNAEISRDFIPPVSSQWEPTEGEWFASLWSTDSDGNANSDFAELSVSFFAGAGFELSFDYFFDYGDFAPFEDNASVTLEFDGGSQTLLSINEFGELDDDQDLGWNSFAYNGFAAAGIYTLRFRINDAVIAGPGSFESILGIDNVVLIPAPGSVALLGVAGLAGVRRRR